MKLSLSFSSETNENLIKYLQDLKSCGAEVLSHFFDEKNKTAFVGCEVKNRNLFIDKLKKSESWEFCSLSKEVVKK